MFRRRDHESFIGGYDPEREMPDPDREYRDRYQSDVYRHNAADSRWSYRWNPDRFEGRFGPRRGEEWGRNAAWERDVRDRERERMWDERMRYGNWRDRDRDYGYGYRSDYDRGYDRDRYDRDYGYGASELDRARERDRDDYERDRRMDYERDRDYGIGWGRRGRY